MFGTENGEYVGSFKTAWESLLLIANGHETKRAKPGARVDRAKLHQIDLHWHDLRHEGACRLLADGVDIRIIQRRTLKAVAGGAECLTKCHTCVTPTPKKWRARQDSNLRPSA